MLPFISHTVVTIRSAFFIAFRTSAVAPVSPVISMPVQVSQHYHYARGLWTDIANVDGTSCLANPEPSRNTMPRYISRQASRKLVY